MSPDLYPPVLSKMLTIQQVRDLPPVHPLIDGLLDLDSTSILYGARGSYKSFLALDWALSVACGVRWQSRPVEYGPVVYVAAEGVSGLSVRVDAWLAHHPGHDPGDRLRILPEAVNLLSPSMVGAFADACAAIRPRLIVIDTLSRCFVGGDENGGKDGSVGVEQWDVIRRRTGACVLLVHHSGKNRDAGSRGWTGWEAAADHVYEADADNGGVVIRCTKAKNHAEPTPMRLKALQVGESMVLDVNGDVSHDVSPGALETLRTLMEIDTGTGVSTTVWERSGGVAVRSFYRHRGALIRAGLIRNIGSTARPLYQATSLATAITATEVPL